MHGGLFVIEGLGGSGGDRSLALIPQWLVEVAAEIKR
jgi:hypothetical protein